MYFFWVSGFHGSRYTVYIYNIDKGRKKGWVKTRYLVLGWSWVWGFLQMYSCVVTMYSINHMSQINLGGGGGEGGRSPTPSVYTLHDHIMPSTLLHVLPFWHIVSLRHFSLLLNHKLHVQSHELACHDVTRLLHMIVWVISWRFLKYAYLITLYKTSCGVKHVPIRHTDVRISSKSITWCHDIMCMLYPTHTHVQM